LFCALLTNGQVASITFSPFALARSMSAGGTPCDLIINTPPSASSSDDIGSTPILSFNIWTAWGLWMIGPNV